MLNDKTVYILCGIPTAGKSTWATNVKRLYWNSVILSRDEIRLSVFNLKSYKDYVFSKENENLVTKVFNDWIEFYSKNHYTIIIDNTHCRESYIDNWIELFNKKEYDIVIKYFDISLKKAWFRNQKRRILENKFVPWKAIRDMKK